MSDTRPYDWAGEPDEITRGDGPPSPMPSRHPWLRWLNPFRQVVCEPGDQT
jgi:hypothetical protein